MAAGLKVTHRSGIYFKTFAIFQWDRLLQNDIILKGYLKAAVSWAISIQTCAPTFS